MAVVEQSPLLKFGMYRVDSEQTAESTIALLKKISYFTVMTANPKNPLHGLTLEAILKELVAHYGWQKLGGLIAINCFLANPSIKSSLTFLRKTPWARSKVESLYLEMKSSKNNPKL
ncbi:MAG: VF530 family DNA-binding protein [Bacteriovoracaceae bacterium]